MDVKLKSMLICLLSLMLMLSTLAFETLALKTVLSELLSPKDSSHILSCSLVIWMTIVLKITFVLGNHWYLDNQTRTHRQSQEDELFVSWMLLAWSMKTDWPVCLCDIAWHVTPVACIDCDWSILILWIGDHALVC